MFENKPSHPCQLRLDGVCSRRISLFDRLGIPQHPCVDCSIVHDFGSYINQDIPAEISLNEKCSRVSLRANGYRLFIIDGKLHEYPDSFQIGDILEKFKQRKKP